MSNVFRTAALLVLVAGLAAGQRSRTEVVKPTTPRDDAKPNSAEVPEAFAISSQFERIVVLRFKYQSDLLGGIERMVREQRIHNAVFLSGIGSVRNYHVHTVTNREFPSKNLYTKDPKYPADIVSINGYVIGGRVHAHMTMADTEKAFGGHIEPDTNVFTFAVVTLGVLPDSVDLSKVDDKTYR